MNTEPMQQEDLVRQAQILNALPTCIALLDAEGVILSVNDAWRRSGAKNALQDPGYGVGLNYLDICDRLSGQLPEAVRVASGIRSVLSGEANRFSMEYPCQSPTEQCWSLATVTPLTGSHPYGVLVTHEDITSRKLAEFRLHRLNRLHAVLSKIGETIARMPSRQVLYDTVCRLLVEYGLLRMVFVAQVDSQAKLVRPIASFGPGLNELLEPTGAIPTDGGPLSEGTVGTAIRTGKPDFCNDIGSTVRMKPWQEAARKNGFLANASFPLRLRGAVVGIMVLCAGETDYFLHDEIGLLEALSNALSFALEAEEIEQEQRIAEERVRQSASLLGMASRLGRLGAWTIDMSSRSVTWSKEIFALLERPQDYLPSFDKGLDAYPPEYRAKIASALDACMNDGTPFDLELQVDTAKGRRIWVKCIGEAVHGADGGIHQIRGAFQDISDQKRTEERLRLSEERFRNMFSTAAIGIAVSTPDGHYLQVNAAYCRMLGYTEKELLGRNFATVTHLDDLAMNLQLRDQLLAGERDSFVMEKRYQRKNGENIWTRHSVSALRTSGGEVVTLMVIAEDITERRQAQEALQRQQTELRVLFDFIPAMVCFKDTANNFIRVNRRLADMTGRPVSELEGKSAFEIYPQEAEKYYADDLQVIGSGEPRLGIVEKLRNKDGNVIWLQTDKVPYQDASGAVIGLVVLSHDITERKKEQDELRELNVELESRVRERTAALDAAREEAVRANKAKSDFLAMMSHEIRTPLNGVIGMLDVIYKSSLQPYQMEMLDLIRESGFSLVRIIDDILDFSKIEAGRLDIEQTPICISDLVEKACSTLGHFAFKRKAELSLFIDPDIPETVLGDGLRLRQVIINLVNNAIKFSSGREQTGRISVRAILVSKEADQVVIGIEVSDNGIGMDEATQARLFAAFTQADTSITRRFGGTGLGLVISRHLIELMGGELVLQSVPDHGTTFKVALPFATTQAGVELSAPINRETMPDVSGLSCILIAEPDELTDNISAYLVAGGARVERATGMDDARALMLDPSAKQWILIIPIDAVPPTWAELRSIAQDLPEQDMRFILVERDSRIEARVEYLDLTVVGGNILTRRRLLQAVSIAAGRSTAEKVESVAPKSEREFALPSREEAQRNAQLILVAEDNEINQMVTQRQLALLGFAADVADTGAKALALWRRGNYALLLTDLHMPDMDGYELATRIRLEERSDHRIPIIALSANALKGEDDRCIAAGMDCFLSKPLQLAALEATLQKWLGPPLKNSAKPGADSMQESRSQVVDLNVLKTFIGDDPSAVPDFLKSFQINAARLSALLKEAFSDGQMAQASKYAHTLKSSSHYVGALTLSQLCLEIEEAGNKSDAAAISMLLPKFEREFDAVNAFLNSLQFQNAGHSNGS